MENYAVPAVCEHQFLYEHATEIETEEEERDAVSSLHPPPLLPL